MRKYSLMAGLLLLTFLLGFQLAEPVAASSWVKIDQKTMYLPDSQYGNVKIVWKVYKKTKSKIWIHALVYEKKEGSTKYTYQQQWNDYLNKISKTKIKLRQSKIGGGYVVSFAKTKYTAYGYYWHVYKPKYMN